MIIFPEGRKLDFICVGRANVDLYAEQDTLLKDSYTFVKSVGGSPANIAVSLNRLGAKVGFIGRVSKDPLGDFVYNYLQAEGVDLAGLNYDASGAKTSLAFAEVKRENCSVVFYRKDAVDMNIQPAEIDQAYIKNAKAVVLTGTAFSRNPSREAMFAIIRHAKENDAHIVLDLDYRASEWTNTAETARHYQKAAELSDIVIGNKEEFEVLDYDNKNHEEMARHLLASGASLVILKNGKEGSLAFAKNAEIIKMGAFDVQAIKPYGAGDAFAGTLLYGLSRGISLRNSLEMASAAGAILVSKFGCAEAMPYLEELEQFMKDHSIY